MSMLYNTCIYVYRELICISYICLYTIYVYTDYLLGGYSVQKVNDKKGQEELRKLKYKVTA